MHKYIYLFIHVDFNEKRELVVALYDGDFNV